MCRLPSNRSSRELKRSEGRRSKQATLSEHRSNNRKPLCTRNNDVINNYFYLHFNISFHLFDDSFLLFTPNPIFFISCKNSKHDQSYRVVKIRELKPNERNENDVAPRTNFPFCMCTCVLLWRRNKLTLYALISTFFYFSNFVH
jgi:hypothetical protein